MAEENLVTVTNNETPPINLEITSCKNIVDINFLQSIESTISAHDVNKNSHANIKSELEAQISLKANAEDLSAALAVIYTKNQTDTLLADKINISDTTITKQGNTFNGANQLVKLDANGKFPALDGSALMNITISNNVISLGTISSGTVIPIQDKIHTVTFSGTSTIGVPTGLISGVTSSWSLIVTMASIVTITHPSTVKWADDYTPILTSTTAKYRITYETIDGGANIFGYWTQLGS